MRDAATAVLALWNDVDPARESAYEDWHAREHVPERLTVPGILWALRYAQVADAASMPRYLTLYGLREPQVLDGAPYRHLLSHPTPASRAMRPALRRIARWVCTLDVIEGIERPERVEVRTVEAGAMPPPPKDDGARLVATRRPEAAALPWLDAGQSQAIAGDRLEMRACDAACARAGRWPQGVVFRRLPVGA